MCHKYRQPFLKYLSILILKNCGFLFSTNNIILSNKGWDRTTAQGKVNRKQSRPLYDQIFNRISLVQNHRFGFQYELLRLRSDPIKEVSTWKIRKKMETNYLYIPRRFNLEIMKREHSQSCKFNLVSIHLSVWLNKIHFDFHGIFQAMSKY